MRTRYAIAVAAVVGFGLGPVAVQAIHAQAKPLGYIITEVEIIDQAAFNEFGPKAAAALQKSGENISSAGERLSPSKARRRSG